MHKILSTSLQKTEATVSWLQLALDLYHSLNYFLMG